MASLIAARHPTMLWARDPDVADEVNTEHTNDAYLARVPPQPEARRHGRPRGGVSTCRAAHRRRADLSRALDVGDGDEVDPPVDPDRQPVQGARAEDVAADDPGDRRRHAGTSSRRPHRTEHRPRDHGRPGRRRGDRHRGPRCRSGDPGGAHSWAVPGLPQPRCRRLRARRGVEERRRHRRRDRPGPRRRRQHTGGGDDPRPRRDHPPRRGDGWRGDDVRRAGRDGRPDHDVRQPAQPQSPRRRAARPRTQARRHPRRDAPWSPRE